MKTRDTETSKSSQRGFTLVEVMVAAVTLMLLFLGMAEIYSNGRSQLVIDEDMRNAVAVAQARLESLREDYRPVDLPGVAANDTTYAVGGRTFTVEHAVATDTPENRASTVTVTVNWTAMVNGNSIPRSVDCTTILGRSSD